MAFFKRIFDNYLVDQLHRAICKRFSIAYKGKTHMKIAPEQL